MSTASLFLHVLAGLVLGLFFYGGLSFTVRHLATTHHPMLWTLGSLWIRVIVVLVGFITLMSGRWNYALTMLLGFTLGRIAVPVLTRHSGKGSACT